MHSPSSWNESENDSSLFFFDERYLRLLNQLDREVTVAEVEEFRVKHPTRLDYEKSFWEDLVRGYTLDEDLILWAKKTIFPKHGEKASGLHKLKSNFSIIHKITNDDRFGLTREESIEHADTPTPRG